MAEDSKPDRGRGSAARRGRPPGDHAERRAELLRAATSIIAADGYGACSLRKVADAAGCTTGAVTYYFTNKSELIAALAEQRFDTYESLVHPDEERAGVRSMLERWLAMTVGDREQWPVMSQLVSSARQEPALAHIFQRRYARFRAKLADTISEGQRRGTIRTDIRADILAENITGMGDGWAMLAPVEPDRFTPARVDELLDAVETLLRPAAG
ncbi:TetR/AcrR family transcriptional regulator [Tsukamurella sp. M9C]|uniref:TetR/AcrR family transcriptional regulator n=1 Tax=unclassified Tsukamurella TaxID=2633480 RepID=UPI001CCBB44A|nr:TetR/AcrR family transcriptional regulator [Tsukamurella sp. M9C]MCA0155288.1 TetR/AcrR family transcriptional regulator [Tsukamurella sp. M9C]